MGRDPGACGALVASLQTYDVPVISEWADPDIGDEPVVAAAPAVIGGIQQ